MVTTTSSAVPAQHHGDDTPYCFVPDADKQATQVQGYGWMEPIIIDDDDLMFGGKSLSTWYEEERKSLSISIEEERRGRQRVSLRHVEGGHYYDPGRNGTNSKVGEATVPHLRDPSSPPQTPASSSSEPDEADERQ
ncbi:hypothetical protein DL769_004377 [Monosporascus sp. CRB-8-3]|nr:hypothetical protein DL769_004377 [Monosporascus sp. CRB-8-3]